MRVRKIFKTELVHNKINLYRMIYSIFGVQIFTGDPMHVILSTVKFSDFNQTNIRSNNFEKINIGITRSFST